MAGLKFTTFSQAARISNLDIDADLDMGVLSVIAAKGRFNEVNLGKTVVTDMLVLPYTVTPSDNVYYTANITVDWFDKNDFTPINGSIVIGPTSVPISPRLLVDIESTLGNVWVRLRVYKNGDQVVNTMVPLSSAGMVTKSVDLPMLVGGDVLTFTTLANVNSGITLSNFRLAGDVVKYVVDGPTAETVYD